MTTPVETVTANERDPVTQSRLDDRGHVLVHFGADDIGPGLDQRLGERPRTGTDLEHEITRRHLSRLDDAAQLIVIVKEVLPEAMLRADATCGEQFADLVETLHECAGR